MSFANSNDPIATLRELVALGCRVLGANGQSDWVWGHVSARDPQGRGVWMKASGFGIDEIAPENVLLIDREGEILEGAGTRHVEYPIHTEVTFARPDIGAVVHTHPKHSVALAAAGEKLRPISHAANMFVPPDVPRFDKTTDLIRTRELGCDVAEALAEHDALFLVNHGIVVVGPDIPTAVVRAIILEQACEQQLLTRLFSTWATWTEPSESLSKRENIFNAHQLETVWSYLVRQLERS